MEVPPIIGQGITHNTGPFDTNQSEGARNAFTAARKLNSLDIANREFTVVRDSASQRFKIVVLDGQTGAVLDQFPPEDILKMLAQISPVGAAKTEDTSE
jgi:uncharacterized FlaG/YvyC family protein